jgi:hypothetical protein
MEDVVKCIRNRQFVMVGYNLNYCDGNTKRCRIWQKIYWLINGKNKLKFLFLHLTKRLEDMEGQQTFKPLQFVITDQRGPNRILVDKEDQGLLSLPWELKRRGFTCEALVTRYVCGQAFSDLFEKICKENRIIYLDRIIAERAYGCSRLSVEHVNGDITDCTRDNLRYTEMPKPGPDRLTYIIDTVNKKIILMELM